MSKFQKIIIPKGSVNPNEITVIEIPKDCKKETVIIDSSCIKTYQDRQQPKQQCSSRSPGKTNPRNANYIFEEQKIDTLPLNFEEFRPKHTSSFKEINPGKNSTEVKREQLTRLPQCSHHITNMHSIQDDNNYNSISRDVPDLESTERSEWLTLKRDLEAFHRARRKLLNATSAVAKSGLDIDSDIGKFMDDERPMNKSKTGNSGNRQPKLQKSSWDNTSSQVSICSCEECSDNGQPTSANNSIIPRSRENKNKK